MRKILSLILLSILTLFFVSGCKENESKETNIDFPIYENNLEFLLSGYLSPNRMEMKYFEWAIDAGLTHLYIDYYNSETESKTHIMEQSLEFCDEVGLKAIPMTCFGRGEYMHSYKEYPIIDKMNEFESFVGFNILDEPKVEDYEYLASEFEDYMKDFPDKGFYTNLLRPNNPKAEFSVSKDKTYNQYIDGFLETVIKPIKDAGYKPIVSETLYPMMNDENGSNYEIMESHLVDLAKFVKKVKPYDPYMYHFVQTVSFGKYHHTTNEAEIRFQVYSGLAFGFDGFQYFTYWTPANNGGEFKDKDYAMIDRTLSRSEEYYGVQAVNQEIKKMQNVLLSFEFDKLILVDGKLSEEKSNPFEYYRANIDVDEPVTSTENLKSISASRDTLISVMKDENDRDGYMVLNYTVPTLKLTDDVVLNFGNVKGCLVYINGEEYKLINNQEANFKKGLLSLSLKEGEGVFIIPIY